MCIDVAASRSIEVDGYSGRFWTLGDGHTVVLLASSFALGMSYLKTATLLAKDNRVVVVEMPGCGSASRVPRAWSYETYAEWVLACLDRLQLARPSLIGHSQSAGVALVLAARTPERVERLILEGTTGGAPTSVFHVAFGRMWDAFYEWKLSVSCWHHVAYNLVIHPGNFCWQTWLAAKEDLTPYAVRVTVPTLLAWGANDHTMPLRGALKLRNVIRYSGLYVSKTGSHDWIVDHPREFVEVCQRFLRS